MLIYIADLLACHVWVPSKCDVHELVVDCLPDCDFGISQKSKTSSVCSVCVDSLARNDGTKYSRGYSGPCHSSRRVRFSIMSVMAAVIGTQQKSVFVDIHINFHLFKQVHLRLRLPRRIWDQSLCAGF
jgi:hypothetical protein